jgi:MtN3 and saliva related transmembrane protein
MDSQIVEIIGFGGNILVLAGYLPQIFKTWKTKKAEDISIMMWIYYLLGDSLLLVYSIMKSDLIFAVLFGVFCAGNLILVYLTHKYGPKSN